MTNNLIDFDINAYGEMKIENGWAGSVTFTTTVKAENEKEAIKKGRIEFYKKYPNEKIKKIYADEHIASRWKPLPALAKGGVTSNIKGYLESLDASQIFDLCDDFYTEDEEWHEIKNDLDKDDLIQYAYDYCKKNKISLKDLKNMLGDGANGFEEMKKKLNPILIPYFEIAYKKFGIKDLVVYDDSFIFYNKNDNSIVTVIGYSARNPVIMYQKWRDNDNKSEAEIDLLTFENYLSNTKMADGGYMAKGGMIVAQKTFDINDNEVSEDIYEFLLDYTSDDFELSEEDQYAIRSEDPERVIDIMNDGLTDYEVVSRYDDDLIRLKIQKKMKMEDVYNIEVDKSSYADGGLIKEIKLFEKYNYPKPKTKGDKVRAIFEHFEKKGYTKDEINKTLGEMKYADGGYMAKGGEMSDEKMTLKLQKEFEGKDLFDDEIVDEYVVKQFDYSEDSDNIEKFIRMKKNKFYVVPFDNQDDSYYYILVPKDKMARGGKLKSNAAKFSDKVKAISKKLAGTKVPKKYKKDYGATYDKQEANEAARRISGAKLAELKAKLAKKTKTKRK
jgi:hypothetical protein